MTIKQLSTITLPLTTSIAGNADAALQSVADEQAHNEAARSLTSGQVAPLRVLHVHSGNLYGGVETMMLTQARQRHLCPALESSFALCFAGRFSEELTAAGATLNWLGNVRIRQPLSVSRARRNLKQLLMNQAFDVVVTHSCWSQAIFGPVARATAVPLVFYLHAQAGGRHWLERWAKRTKPDALVCNSRFTAETVSNLYPQASAEVIYCPVAPPEQSYSETDIKEMRAELQTTRDATVIIQVSRMESLKGHASLLEALSLLKELPDWVCWQVGGAQSPEEEKYLKELKAMADRLGIKERMRFLGQRSDVEKLLPAADIFCQPNLGPDSFGIVYIEAFHARLPVITTSLGGAQEIIEDSCGILVPPDDVRALSAALRRLISDRALRAELGAAGPQRATALCDPATQMASFTESLRCVVPRRASA